MDVFISLHHACNTMTADHFIPVSLQRDRDEDHDLCFHLNIESGHEFDLKIDNQGGKISAEKALHYAQRFGHEHDKIDDIEFYVARGRDIAQSIAFSSSAEYLAAWLNEDRKQANICHDIHAVLSLDLLKKCPQWVRHDLLFCLEAEAMKQVFAKRFKKLNHSNPIKMSSALEKAIGKSASDHVDPLLSKLMAEITHLPMRYNDSAKLFDEQAQSRIQSLQKKG